MNGQYGDSLNQLALVAYLNERDVKRPQNEPGLAQGIRGAAKRPLAAPLATAWRRLRARTVGSA